MLHAGEAISWTAGVVIATRGQFWATRVSGDGPSEMMTSPTQAMRAWSELSVAREPVAAKIDSAYPPPVQRTAKALDGHESDCWWSI